jgi:hypothetical protein
MRGVLRVKNGSEKQTVTDELLAFVHVKLLCSDCYLAAKALNGLGET